MFSKLLKSEKTLKESCNQSWRWWTKMTPIQNKIQNHHYLPKPALFLFNVIYYHNLRLLSPELAEIKLITRDAIRTMVRIWIQPTIFKDFAISWRVTSVKSIPSTAREAFATFQACLWRGNCGHIEWGIIQTLPCKLVKFLLLEFWYGRKIETDSYKNIFLSINFNLFTTQYKLLWEQQI